MNVKPATARTGKTGKVEKSKREEVENTLKSEKEISNKAPTGLSDNGKDIYKEIINLMPKGFLNGADTYTVSIVAEALDRMQTAQKRLNSEGLFTEMGEERDASKSYERYSKIFDKFGGKIGLSPRDRAALAALMLKDEKKEDPLMAILADDD
jgi:P27 family predicted phage terminase small subunit